MKKILIIGPAWVGDMVMAQTLFQLLQRREKVVIDVLAPDATRPLLNRMPEVHQALAWPFPHGQLQLKKRWQIGRALRAQYYDWAIVLPNSFKSALPLLVARIPRRTGFKGEWRFGLLNDIRILDKKALSLMIERFMALGLAPQESIPRPFPQPHLQTDAENTQKIVEKLNLTLDKPILALCPGAEYGPAKRWLSEYYAAVAQNKIQQGWQVWIFGSPKDKMAAEEIQQFAQNQCIDLTGKTQLTDAIDLLALAEAVITNDSGLMHVAAALDRPIVAIYGSSSPQFTPPLCNQVKIISLNLSCSPCFQRQCPLGHFKCMRDLKPPQVLHALNELLA